MPNYLRARHPGGLYFFTVNLAERNNDLLVRHIDRLRESVRDVRQRHPFGIHAWVVLPDHLHCVLEMPRGRFGLLSSVAPDQGWVFPLLARAWNAFNVVFAPRGAWHLAASILGAFDP